MLDRRDLLKLGGATVGVGLVAGFGGAQDGTPTGTETGTETTTGTEGTPRAPPEGDFFAAARLTGANQPEPVDTSATGATVFTQTDDGLAYELFVADIENVTQAHVHLAPEGEDGPVVQWLYPAPDATEPDLIEGGFDGLLAADTITGDNLVGDLEGENLAALISEMEAGNTYVNVHTEANPGGEIRGQIRLVQTSEGAPTGTETEGTEGETDGTETGTEMGTDTEMAEETTQSGG